MNIRNDIGLFLFIFGTTIGSCHGGSIEQEKKDAAIEPGDGEAAQEENGVENLVGSEEEIDEDDFELDIESWVDAEPHLVDDGCVPNWVDVGQCNCTPTPCDPCSGTKQQTDGCGHSQTVSCELPATGCNTVCCSHICCAVSQNCIGNVCCDDTSSCGSHCCTSSETCVSSTCCSTTKACGNVCCPSSQTCVSGACCDNAKVCGSDCCTGAESCCGSVACCLPSWRRGNTHTHSELSDGDPYTPQQVADAYKQKGYQFLVLTDHNVWSNFGQYSTSDFVAINGEEVTTGIAHMNALGISTKIDPTSMSRQQILDAIYAASGVATFNHPTWVGLPLSLNDLWPLDNLHIIEIYNHLTEIWGDPDRPGETNDGGFDELLWDGLLTAGKDVLGVASDDCHNPPSHAGYGWIMVRTFELNVAEILQAVAAGDFYASSGVTLTNLVATADQLQVLSSNGEYVEFIGHGGKVLSATKSQGGQYTCGATDHYVRARVTGSAGKAWTQPVLCPRFLQDPFADRVVDGDGLSADAQSHLIGPVYPGRTPTNWADYAARISAGHYVVLDMGEGEEISDGSGVDLYIEEVDAEDSSSYGADPYAAWVSQDCLSWFSLGSGTGDAYFDLAPTGLTQARYVKIEVSSGDAEIESVMTLDPIMRDPYADNVVEVAGVTMGNAVQALGPPFPGQVPSNWDDYSVRIKAVDGRVGVLVLDMGAGEEILNHAGADLMIEEVDAEDGVGGPDPYTVSASIDGANWILLGNGSGDTSFDLTPAGLSKARYIKIEVTTGDAEIDALSEI